MRIGLGFDVHNTKSGKPLVIGGVIVPCEFGLDGDSDADVLCHSVIDAVLGALNLGDIGSYFGVGTPDMMGVESLSLLARLTPLIGENRMTVSNLDCTIIAQYPKLSDKREQMRANIARVLQTPQNRISLKFTTPKGLGPLGNKEGIACLSAILLEEKNNG